MTQVLDWHGLDHSLDVLSRAVDALVTGQLVAFPTETVYGLAASALLPEALERLVQSKDRPEGKPLTLAIPGAAEALDWVPAMSHLARRLCRRCWPGPVTLVFEAGVNNGLASRLHEDVRRRVCPAGVLGLRVPAHDAILQTLRLLDGPLVLSSANRRDEQPAVTAQEVVAALGEDVALVIDDGPSYFGRPSTVVRVDGNRWSVLREGVISAAELEQLTPCMIVFVCTGNTCRSPLAEVLCKQLLAARLGCRPEELPQRGFLVLSAGIAAMMGGKAAPEAVEAARELGADLAGHISRPLTANLVFQADYLVTMTQSHSHALVSQYPGLGPPPRLLSAEGLDIADPIGSDLAVYRECAHQIINPLEGFLAELSYS